MNIIDSRPHRFARIALLAAVSLFAVACTDTLADEDEDFVQPTGTDMAMSADATETTDPAPDATATAGPDTSTSSPDAVEADAIDADATGPDATPDTDVAPPICTADAECASGEVCLDGACITPEVCSDVCDCENGCRVPDDAGACVCDPDPLCQGGCPCFASPGVCSCFVPSIDSDEWVCPGGQPDPMAEGSCAAPGVVSFDLMSGATTAQWQGDSRNGVDAEYGCAMNTPDTGLEVVYRLPTHELPPGTLNLSVQSDADHWLAAADWGESQCGFISVAIACENRVEGSGVEQLAVPIGNSGNGAESDVYVVVGADGPGGEFTVEADFVPSICGNGIEEPGERCDGNDTGAVDCAFVNYQSGSVTCEAGCQGYDYGACEPWVQNETEPNVGAANANDFVNPWIGSAAGGDSDWMVVEVTQAGSLRAEIHPINGAYTLVENLDTDVSIGFADAQGQFISGATYSHSIAVQPGTYYVIVNVFGAAPTFGYRVDVQID